MNNEGITKATLKLADIIGELTEKTLTTWPTKGQLQASNMSLKYAVLHKAAIVNLEPTSNNMNVSEALGRMQYAMRLDQQLNNGKVIFDQMVDHSKTSAKLKSIDFPSLIYSMLINQHLDVLKKEDGFGEDAKSLSISDKLIKGKHVVNVELNAADQTEVVLEGEGAVMLIKAYKEEHERLEVDIHLKKVRVSKLQVKIQALKATVPSTVNDPNTTSTAIHDEPDATAETSKSPV
ncbi:hypothetical protein LIER_21725 [Lithospermum erythrorhizon]|uniref:Uncharacterized protein n=1 Tax=Lithospermum erythrorhizon TaxID=34254 RepID=A0AAV3QST0_LITER